jgi:hypothetical protein
MENGLLMATIESDEAGNIYLILCYEKCRVKYLI